MADVLSTTDTVVRSNGRTKVIGTFSATTGIGNTRDTIDTGLAYVEEFKLIFDSHVGAPEPRYFLNQNAAGTTTNGTVAFLAGVGLTGTWIASGTEGA